MSISDAERFAQDLSTNSDLRDAVKEAATGLASVVEFAKSKGYEFTIDEAKEFILSRSPQDLTDEQLDAVAGGKHHHHSSAATSNTVVQTAGVATTAAEAAEVATTAVQVTEAAADVAAAAEVVAVAAAAVVLT